MDRLFKQRDIFQLKDTNVLHVLRTYSEALYKYYISAQCEQVQKADIPLIEFVCIRVIYLSLSLDEMSSSDKLWNMPHSIINTYVPRAWPSPRTIKLEREILALCDWNPLRLCKLLCGSEVDIGLSLWDKKLTETLPQTLSSQPSDAVLSVL